MSACITQKCRGGRAPCPTPLKCGLMTQAGGRFVDTHLHEPTPRPRMFVPDYGIEPPPAPQPWYERVPPFRQFVIVGAIVGFVISIYRSY